MRPFTRRVTTAILFTIATSSAAFSCWCTGPSNAKTMREFAEWYATNTGVNLIFKGTVARQELPKGSVGMPPNALSMTGEGTHRIVEFDVTKIFRGDKQEHIFIVSGMGGSDCGVAFETGHEYLVFAIKAADGKWFTSSCNGTDAVEDAGTKLRFLEGEKPTAEDLLSPENYQRYYLEKVLPSRTGSVCGHVLKPDGTPLQHARVELWSHEPPYWGVPDLNTGVVDGHFCVHAFPGRYILTVEANDFDHFFRYMAFYPGVDSESEATPLSIKTGVKLPDVSFKVLRESLYNIHIRVKSPAGTQLPLKDGCCSVRVDSIYSNPLSYHIENTLKEDGSYTFGYLPPGKYIVAVSFQPDIWHGQPNPFADADKWIETKKEVTVNGETEVVIQMEPAPGQ